jgi:hypothetical protein
MPCYLTTQNLALYELADGSGEGVVVPSVVRSHHLKIAESLPNHFDIKPLSYS